jgi:hypothetical protein
MSSLRLIAVCAVLGACSRSEPAAPAPSASAPALQAAEPSSPPSPVVEDTTFRLSLTGAPEFTSGAASALALTLEARGGYHVNQEYPIRIDLKAPTGVKLGKASLARSDATLFTEPLARFEVPFSAEAGSHNVTATVDFAVCTAETCVPDQRTLALALQVR